MAATPKFGAEDAKKIEQDIVQAVEVSGADAVASALGKPVKFIQGLLEKGLSTKAGQQLSKSVQDLDKKLLDLRIKAPVTGEAPPPVPAKFKTQSTGPEIPGAVGEPGTAFTTKTPTQPSRGALMPLPENIEAEDITPPTSLARVQQRVQETQPIQPVKQLQPPGRREETLRESLQEGQPGMEQLPEYNLGIGPSKRAMAKAGLGVAGAGAAAAGYRLFGDKPLSQQPDAPSTLKAGDVKDTQELVDLADKAAPTLPPEQAQKTKENAEKIKTIQDLLADVEKRKQQKVDRIELMQAIETMAHGLVTAIGAGVMLNRGSPFAVDFSKGPKVDWASQLDRLQKDFDTQTNALIKKYGIEEDMKVKQEELALKKRGLDIEEQKVAQQVTKQQAEAMAKLTTEQQKQYNTNLKNYGDLRRAIADKKPGAVQDAATLLGADDATIAKLTESMNQGMWDKILTMLGISEQPTTEQILQGLRPQKPAAPAAAPAAVTVGGKTYTRPTGMSDADWAEYVKEVGGQ